MLELMDKEIKNRFDNVDDHFDAVDKLFDEADKRFDSLETSVGELKRSMDDRFELLVGHIADIRVDIDYLKENMVDKKDIQKLLHFLDFHIKKADTYFQEHLMLGNKVDRHEGWISKIAKKTEIKLDY
jgi:hypothetical protein